MTLRVRLGLAAGVAVTIAVVAVAVSSYAGTRTNLQGQIDQSLKNITRQHIDQGQQGQGGPQRGFFGRPRNPGFSGAGDCDRGLGINAPPNPPLGAAQGTVQLVEPNGPVCKGTGETYQIPVDGRAKALAASGHGSYFTDSYVHGTHVRVLVTGIPGYGALMVELPLTDLDHTLHNQLLLLIGIAAGGIALAALLGILVARTALRPIDRFTRRTEAIAVNPDLIHHERLDDSGRDELSRLARTFNATLDALERSVEAQRNLVADASHELRTPIATLRANLQLLRDEHRLSQADRDALREDMIEELDELTGLVGDVVELARGSKPGATREDVRLDQIVTREIERTHRRAPGLTVKASVEPTLVQGEADRIARAVTNLLDNARKWSPPDGVVEVELHAGVLSVRDHGPGFHEQDLPFVFDRFHRASEARSKPGSGLGLAIVRQAAEAHGGFAEAANAPGGGAVVRIGFGRVLELQGEGSSEQGLERWSAGAGRSPEPPEPEQVLDRLEH